MIQHNLCHFFCNAVRRLRYDRQLRITCSRKLQVVKPDHRQLLRNPDAQFVYSDHGPHSHFIIRHKHCCHLRIILYKFFKSPDTALNRIVSMPDQRFTHRDPGTFQCFIISRHTLLCSKNFFRSANDPNISVSSLDKIPDCIFSGFFIINQNTVTVDTLNLSINQNDRFTRLLKPFQVVSLFINRHVDDTVHAPASQEFNCLPFQFLIGSAVADDRRITMTSQDILHTGNDLGTESIVQLRNDNANRSGRVRL